MDELNILTECALFRGLRRAQIREMLPCLSARQLRRHRQKDCHAAQGLRHDDSRV